jgi:hypothetical protein
MYSIVYFLEIPRELFWEESRLYFVTEFFEYKVFEVYLLLSLFELSMYHYVKVLLCVHIIFFYFFMSSKLFIPIMMDVRKLCLFALNV